MSIVYKIKIFILKGIFVLKSSTGATHCAATNHQIIKFGNVKTEKNGIRLLATLRALKGLKLVQDDIPFFELLNF